MTTFASLKIVRARTDYANKPGVPKPHLLNAAPAAGHRLAKQIKRMIHRLDQKCRDAEF